MPGEVDRRKRPFAAGFAWAKRGGRCTALPSLWLREDYWCRKRGRTGRRPVTSRPVGAEAPVCDHLRRGTRGPAASPRMT